MITQAKRTALFPANLSQERQEGTRQRAASQQPAARHHHDPREAGQRGGRAAAQHHGQGAKEPAAGAVPELVCLSQEGRGGEGAKIASSMAWLEAILLLN